MIKVLFRLTWLKVILFFLMIQFVYFFCYAWSLSGRFTVLQLAFIGILSSTYLILLFMIRHYIWRGALYGLLAIVYIWALLNYAHLKVFGVFISMKLLDVTVFKGGYWDLISGFYTLVPWYVYLISIGCLSISIFISSMYFHSFEKKQIFSFDLVRKSLMIRALLFLGYGVLLIAINIGGVSLVSYFQEHPRASWWDIRGQVIDFGVVGHTYLRLTDLVSQYINPLAHAREFATSNMFLGDVTGLSNYEQTKKLYDLAGFGYDSISNLDVKFKKNSYPNVLIIQLESIGSWAVEHQPTPMPFLSSLIQDNISVNNFIPNSCETINAEFSSLCGVWADSSGPIAYKGEMSDPLCLPKVLSDRYGYETFFFHANIPDFWGRHSLIGEWGFDHTMFTPELKQKEYDAAVFDVAIKRLSGQSRPFFAYITTFTTHAPHNDELINYYNNRHGEIIKPYTGELQSYTRRFELDEVGVRNYFGFLTAEDNSLKRLFTRLNDSGLAENTIVMIYNDHRYYAITRDSSEEHNLENFYLYNRSPFVVVTPDRLRGRVGEIASHIDIAPTVLHMIDGDSKNKPNRFLGTSLFSAEHKDQVMNKCLGDVFYLNRDVLVRGNPMINAYRAMSSRTKNGAVSDAVRMRLLVESLVETSDLILRAR